MDNLKYVSPTRVIVFLLLLVGSTILYYKEFLTVESGANKKLALAKKIMYYVILLGIIQMFSTATERDYKTLLLVILVIMVNIYNMNDSLKKCTAYPSLYKLRLYIGTVLVIIFMALFIYTIDGRGILSFLYTGDVDDSNQLNLNQFGTRDEKPAYCPDIGTSDIAGYRKVLDKSHLSPEEINYCIAYEAQYRERSDMNKNIYA